MRTNASARVVLFMILSLVVSSPSLAALHRVNADGSGDYPTIQAAIDGTSPGDTVALGDGLFTGQGNRDIVFHGKAIVVISLSGDPDLCVVDAQASGADQHRVFRFAGAEGSSTVLDGITVQGGYSRTAPEDRGGGILCGPNSAPSILNCVIAANRAEAGGGLFAAAGSHPTIQGCRFENNSSFSSGGAIGCASYEAPAPFLVSNCSFSGNVAGYDGGCIVIASTVEMADCVFSVNRGEEGGVFYICGSGDGRFERCTFMENSASMGNVGFT
jgi:predicted outer membrane repeat protein